jgi:hypothetical protein
MSTIFNTIGNACSNFTFVDAVGAFTNTVTAVGCVAAGGVTTIAVNWAGHKILKNLHLENNFAASTAVKVSAFAIGIGVSVFLAPQLGLVSFAAEKMIPGAIMSVFGITSFVFSGAFIGYVGSPALAAFGMLGAGIATILYER